MFVSQGIKDFCEAMIASPMDWVQGDYSFVNTKSRDLSIWTCNGVDFINIGGNGILNIFEKRYIARTIKQTMAAKLRCLADQPKEVPT